MAASGWASCDLNIRNAILDALVEIDVTPQVRLPLACAHRAYIRGSEDVWAQTDKRFINLTLGDPTSNPALQPPATATDAVIAAVRSGAYNGYGPTDGLPGTKAALAEFYSVPSAGLHYTPADVFMANGTSGAIDLIVTVLGRRGGNMLFPRPGFAYSPSPNARGVEDRYYNLIPEREWEVDLAHLDTLVDENTVAIFINK
jgi:tyrosine aminotransferase